MKIIGFVLAGTLYPALLLCQPSGEIRLNVKDASGAAVVASGKLFAGAVERSFETNQDGSFLFTGLTMGRYRLQISKPGFDSQTILVNVTSAIAVVQTITLAIGIASFNVNVIAATPLPGVELAPNEIAAPVQSATARDLDSSGARDLSDFLNRHMNGVHVNEIQGNPYQQDVNYRGYTASPLLGTPQGLSIYMDGVRLNQPFGDVVSWDLIPRIVIAEMTLMPGSNPLFGLNTLGGSLAVETKDGVRHPGTALQLSGGSFGRKSAEFEHGGSTAKGLSWYTAGNLYFEDGWRESSPSNVRQFFGKLGWQKARTTLGVSVSYANNSLSGNGLQEPRFLVQNYSSVYTKPDITNNRAPMLNVTARQMVTSKLTLLGNAYYRYIGTSTLNGDLNERSLDQSVYQPSAADRVALAAAGYTGFPSSGATAANTPFPSWRCIAQSLQRDEPAEKCNGLLNRTRSRQHNAGGALQMTYFGTISGMRNQLTAGAAWDRSSVQFQQTSQLGYINPDHSITGVNSFGDGVTGGNVDGEPFDTRVNLQGVIRTQSVYATDALSLGRALVITASGRYNHTTLSNLDNIRPTGLGTLSSQNVFDRFNPAVGVTFNPAASMNLYLGYSEGSRSPTSIELGCADPNLPCKLPNALAGDPPLLQVVTRTVEAGVRGSHENNLTWSAGWFRAENRNDILFVASTQTGFGYFKNFGKTRRQGLELDVKQRVKRVVLGGGYTLLNATYESAETLNASGNSTSDKFAKGLDGTIRIAAGASIPLIPKHMLKAYADVQATKKLSFDLGMVAISSTFARANENNLHQPDGVYYTGSGKTDPYGVANLGARYQVHGRVQLFVQINNLLDQRYSSAAQLGPTGFSNAGAFVARPFAAASNGAYPVVHATFFAPGAPRAAVGGVRLKF